MNIIILKKNQKAIYFINLGYTSFLLRQRLEIYLNKCNKLYLDVSAYQDTQELDIVLSIC